MILKTGKLKKKTYKNMKIGTMRFSKGSIINVVPVEQMNNAEKGAFIASQENKGRKVIIEGYNDNDDTEE